MAPARPVAPSARGRLDARPPRNSSRPFRMTAVSGVLDTPFIPGARPALGCWGGPGAARRVPPGVRHGQRPNRRAASKSKSLSLRRRSPDERNREDPRSERPEDVSRGLVTGTLYEWNAKGGINGRPILLIEEDDASKTAGAVTAYNKVIDKDICAMFGQTYSTQVLAEAPFIIKTGVPYVFSATNPKITQMGNKWMFRLRTNDEVVGQILAHYVVDKLKLKKVALTYGNEEYGRTGAKVVEDTLKSLGVTPVAITTHTPNDKDFTAQMLNMKKAEAECIISYCFVQEHGLMIKQKHELAMDNVVYFGSPTMTTPITMKLAGEAADYNIYGVADWVRTDPRPDSLAWVTPVRLKIE